MVVKFRKNIWPPPPQLSLHQRAALSSNSNGTRSVYSRENPKSSLHILWDVYDLCCSDQHERQEKKFTWDCLERGDARYSAGRSGSLPDSRLLAAVAAAAAAVVSLGPYLSKQESQTRTCKYHKVQGGWKSAKWYWDMFFGGKSVLRIRDVLSRIRIRPLLHPGSGG
jgi:hypothetical protein